MDKENIKLAFSRVKEDILFLTNELTNLKYELKEIKILLNSFIDRQTDQQTDQQVYSTQSNIPTHNPTVPQEIGGLKTPNIGFSIGNEGVPTDRQTDQQTGFHKENLEINLKKTQEVLDSLDTLKKEIRQKFKHLTPQEMAVFSSIYQFEEQNPENTTYKQIANKLKLSESSIRDYVLKIIDKGIPIKKEKIDNKKILLSISPELKKLAALSTIIQLREL
jgi:DNA-binding MarR family transcriptional regulator